MRDVGRPGASSVRPAPTRQTTVASFPPPFASTNPYQQLLYGSLAELGFVLAPPTPLRSKWLWRSRKEVGCLHFHWLTGYYHHARFVPRLIRLLLFAQRLVLARLLGYRVVWTVHEIYPHTRLSRTDTVAPHIVARLADSLIVHDESTRQKVVATLGRDPVVIPHGTFAGRYPRGRSRDHVRRRLDIPDSAVLVLAFGLIRRYKRLDNLASALALLPEGECDDLVVLIAGEVRDADVSVMLEAAGRTDERLRLHLEFVPDAEVVELFDACDTAVVTRRDDGTSGVLVLALSLGVPVIVADTPSYRSLTEASPVKHWFFSADDTRSLADALRSADAELRDRSSDPRVTPEIGVEWSTVAARTAQILTGDQASRP